MGRFPVEVERGDEFEIAIRFPRPLRWLEPLIRVQRLPAVRTEDVRELQILEELEWDEAEQAREAAKLATESMDG